MSLIARRYLSPVLLALAAGLARADDAADIFRQVVAPALEAKCVACHNPSNSKGRFDLTTREAMLRGGKEGDTLHPGLPEESEVYLRSISHSGEKPEMPKKGETLSASEANSLRDWITAGARWPDGFELKNRARADKSFWSFQPLSLAPPPSADAAPIAWRSNPIDRFIFAAQAQRGLHPSSPTDAASFIRQASYDLTGLPPSPEEVSTFIAAWNSDQQAAVEALVDQLLASPRYGEQWGRHWLDVIRFGESRGYERNEIITNLWPFRDYVIRSFNDDKPFDRFIHEQLAGDVLAPGDPAVEMASAFLVAGPYDDVGNQDAVAAAQIRADELDEIIRASSEAFLGLSLGCARCHDHKFDPLTQKDYYGLYATFAGTVHGDRELAPAALRDQRNAKLKEFDHIAADLESKKEALLKESGQVPTANQQLQLDQLGAASAENKTARGAVSPLPVWWIGKHQPAPGPFTTFLGGSPQRPGDPVLPSSLSVFSGPSAYQLPLSSPEGERRLTWAQWLTAPDNPLTPRVLANRLWHYHFGTGLVDTPSDFGYLGGRPSHPELLDWLARELQAGGWRIKPLHRLILTSQTYRQSSAWSDAAAKIDSESRYLWRFPPRRLAAEEIRDTMLSVAGVLELTMGGPGFRLYDYQQDNVATYVPRDHPGPETYRRAVYHHNARAARVDLMTDFDCPDPAFSEPRRSATTTPLQALTLMNHDFSLAMSTTFADRLAREAPGSEVERAFALAYGRLPSPEEISRARVLIASHGLRAFCRALLNSTELISLN